MPTLPGQRAQFTWALRKYRQTDDPAERAQWAERMAHHLKIGQASGWPIEQVSQGADFPAEVTEYLNGTANPAPDEDRAERQAEIAVAETVDISERIVSGSGDEAVYAYGYRCAPDRLKVGSAAGDVVQRIAQQIYASTPDKPVLYLVYRTSRCRALERVVHGVLELRGLRIRGGGAEWFKVTRDEVLTICEYASNGRAEPSEH
jgi:hypothetical protein